MIRITNLSFSYTQKPIFDRVSFTVGENQKVGLVGPNGSGKTTLLKFLAREENPDQGKIEIIGQIGWVPQEVKHDLDMEKARTIRDYLTSGNTVSDFELKKVLSGLELARIDLNLDPRELSGGQKTKLALARALISKPDILLLDEPTNFMDIVGKAWVADFLRTYPKTLILISHDLALVDRAIDKILAINPQTGKVNEYKGNYTQAMKLKAEKEALLKRQITVEQKHIKNMEEGLKKLYKFTSKKGVRARVRLARRIEKLKVNLPELPPEIRKIKINLPDPTPVGELPIKVVNVVKSYGPTQVLDGISFSLKRGEIMALIGHNGAGKSTLLKILVGQLTPDSGKVIKNPGLNLGYYSQEMENFDLDKTVIDTFTEDCHKDENFARPFLGRYMFLGDKVFQRVGTLSGGEKTRLAIACLTAHNYNLLTLDEPTTYLDVLSQRVVLDALKQYTGAMIIVSHTPEFIKELQPDVALLLPESRFTFWSDDFLDQVETKE